MESMLCHFRPCFWINKMSLRNVFKIERFNGKTYISLDDFFLYLKKHHKTSDTRKTIRRNDLKDIFTKHKSKDTLIQINSKECIETFGVLQFIFSHAEQLDSCFKLAEIINSSTFSTGAYVLDNNADYNIAAVNPVL